MTKEALAYVANKLDTLSVPYEFMEWTGDLTFPFFVGEYSENPDISEDGLEDGVFILTGVSNQSSQELEDIKSKIKKEFPPTGATEILKSGSGIAVSYDSSFPIYLDDGSGLHKIQINLSIKEWRI